ncbi:MAG: hypothetical protein EPO68_00335 [Planctomycetota bacterium]|nr:MAG: hypothetical protein EPO68_00335 [Planctomycetota bacterium]
MNFFCSLFGHTWVAHTAAPQPRWNTTKDGVVLVPSDPPTHADAAAVRYFDRCQRCGSEREAPRPAVDQRAASS